jgi:hypothetical protein
MLRKRFVLLAVACCLGVAVGCQSLCDRPLLARWFAPTEPECCESGSLIYDGPPLPEAGPMIAPPTHITPLPPPTPLPPGAAPSNGRLVPQPQAQSQPMPYTPPR